LAVHIRLRRVGKKKQPSYRIVAADSRRARDGRFLEALGTYSPVDTPASVIIKEERLTKWLDEGAIPSDTVSSLLTHVGFLEKYEKSKRGMDVSDLTIRSTITERRKRTRKIKKAAVAATAEESPKVTAEESPKATAEESPEETAEENPKVTAEESPKATAEESPEETAEESAQETAGETVEKTDKEAGESQESSQ